MTDYSPQDSLAYLADSVLASLDAANAEIQDINGTCPEFDELPDNLQNAIYILDSIREAIRKEAMHHNVHRATHYSNGYHRPEWGALPPGHHHHDAPIRHHRCPHPTPKHCRLRSQPQ